MSKFYLIFLLLTFCLFSLASAQELQLTFGKKFESARSSAVRVDDVVFYENNVHSQYYPLGLSLNVPVSRRLSYVSGIQFYRPGTSYAAYKDTVCFLCPVVKVTFVSHYTLEFPQHVGFSIFKTRKWNAAVLAGITPALRITRRGIEHTVSPNPPDWDAGVIEALNAAPSTVKRAYINYNYGFQIQYDRFGALVYWQQNIDGSIANPLVVGDKLYPFTRRTGSIYFGLTYSFLRLKKSDD